MLDFPPQNYSDSAFFREHPINRAPPPQPPSTTTRILIVKVASGCDIIESILDIARRHQTSLAIQSAFGSIASVTLSETDDVSAVIAYGPFNILSLSGSYFYDNPSTLSSEATTLPPSYSFGIHLSTSHGRVFGGNIGGPVIAYKEVTLIIFAFQKPKLYKFISENDEDCGEDSVGSNKKMKIGTGKSMADESDNVGLNTNKWMNEIDEDLFECVVFSFFVCSSLFGLWVLGGVCWENVIDYVLFFSFLCCEKLDQHGCISWFF